MILYFSGTGNSLAIARQIAEKVDDKIMPLREAIGKNLTGEKRIGLVYPTYWLDAPIAVRDIVPQLNISPSSYTFVVITCGAQTNNAVWSVRRILRQKGVMLSYCNKIRVPDSSALAFGRNPNSQVWKFERYAPRLDQIVNDIATEKQTFHFAGFDPLGWILNRPSIAAKTQNSTRPACNTDKCVGCGVCAKVCPQKNITISDGKAHIGDNCAMCLACVHFCPQQSMEVNGKATLADRQYHHPKVRVGDMMSNKTE